MGDSTQKTDTDPYTTSGLASALATMHDNGALNDGEYTALTQLALRYGQTVAADTLSGCGRSVAASYQTGLADARRQITVWADRQMQDLPEQRNPAAHGKAELLRDLQEHLTGSQEQGSGVDPTEDQSPHTVTVEFDKHSLTPTLTFTCHAPADAGCRTLCPNSECEEGCVDPSTHTREPIDYCNVVVWMENTEDVQECIFGGASTSITAPVDIRWGGSCDGPDWRFAATPPDEPDAYTAALTAQRDALRARLAAVEAALPTSADFDRQRAHIRQVYTSAVESGMLLGSVNVEERLVAKIREAIDATPPTTGDPT